MKSAEAAHDATLTPVRIREEQLVASTSTFVYFGLSLLGLVRLSGFQNLRIGSPRRSENASANSLAVKLVEHRRRVVQLDLDRLPLHVRGRARIRRQARLS